MKGFRSRLGLVFMVMILLVAACGETSTSPTEVHGVEDLPELEAAALTEGEKLRVVATTSIVGDVVAQVGGDGIELTVLLEPGQDPHAYQPNAQDLGIASDAHVIFVNGFDLEESILEDLASAAEGVPMVAVSAGIEPLETATEDNPDAHDEETEDNPDAHDHAEDPHVWFNVSHVETWTDNIKQVLSDLDPTSNETYKNNSEAYHIELKELDSLIHEIVKIIPEPNRKLVTNHDAYAYLADTYGFEIIGTIIPTFSTNAEPSAENLSELIETIKQEQAQAIFIDSSAREGLAKVVADETGAAVFELYTESLGEVGSGADSYIGMMQTNIEIIRDALGE